MLLSARLLVDVGGVNNFDFTSTLQWTQGDQPLVYFQLVDTSVESQLNPPGRRWMPPILADQPVALTAHLAGTPSESGSLPVGSYWYAVVAYVNGVWTLPSETVAAVTLGIITGVDLTWDAVLGATNYKVFRGTTQGGENILVYTGSTNSTSDAGTSTTSASPSLGTFQALSVTMTDIDSSVTTWAQASNPFAQDQSIWTVSPFDNLPADQIDAFAGTYSFKLALETGFIGTVANITQTQGAIVVDQVLPTTLASTGFIWYGGTRYAYTAVDLVAKKFTLDLTVGPQLLVAPVGGLAVWIPTATLNGYTGQAANITLAQSEF